MRHSSVLASLLLAAASCFNARAQSAPLFRVEVSKHLMGTVVEATVLHEDVGSARAALLEAFQEIERIEHLLSTHFETSEISLLNREAGHAPVPVSRETLELLIRARSYTRTFDDVFDVTVGPLTSYWGLNGDAPVVRPDSTEIKALLALVGIRHLVLDRGASTAFLTLPGARIDLGGVAKGYAVDRAVEILRARGISNFLLNAGGDLFASGSRSDGTPWRVGIKHPRAPDALIATLEAHNEAVATSGDYERVAVIDGIRYHHILDPRTGFPAAGRQSATVLAPTAEEADVLATYAFITGRTGASGVRGAFVVDATGTVTFDSLLVRNHALVVTEP